MSNWRCEICGNRFSNFYEQVLDDKIYCPLCYFKKLSTDYKQRIDKAIEYIDKCRFNEVLIDMGSEYTYETDYFKDNIKSILKGE